MAENIDFDALLAQQVEAEGDDVTVSWRGEQFTLLNPLRWPLSVTQAVEADQFASALRQIFVADGGWERFLAQNPTMVESMRLLQAVGQLAGQVDLGNGPVSVGSSSPIPPRSKPTSRRTTRSTSSTRGVAA